jgi:hypothetical protein
VESAVREHLEQDRMLPGRTGDVYPELGFALGQVKNVSTVQKHRGDGVTREESASIHLGEVLDERGLDAAGLAKDVVEGRNSCPAKRPL